MGLISAFDMRPSVSRLFTPLTDQYNLSQRIHSRCIFLCILCVLCGPIAVAVLNLKFEIRYLKSQTDILFGQSYYLRFDPKLWKAMQPYPPLGTLYAASLMRDKGYSVALFDAMLAESAVEWEAALSRA